MTLGVIAVVMLLAAGIAWEYRGGRKLPAPFSARPCQGKKWHDAFPHIPKQEIRTFLSLFVDAFGFSARERLKLSPNDLPLRIYRVLYPFEWQPDGLEFEVFAASLKSHYGLRLDSIWQDDLTLGQLFRSTRRLD